MFIHSYSEVGREEEGDVIFDLKQAHSFFIKEEMNNNNKVFYLHIKIMEGGYRECYSSLENAKKRLAHFLKLKGVLGISIDEYVHEDCTKNLSREDLIRTMSAMFGCNQAESQEEPKVIN